MKKLCILLTAVSLWVHTSGQRMTLQEILDTIGTSHPEMKMYDAEIQSEDAAARGARAWMAPTVSSGFWMTPYDTHLWKSDPITGKGMGSYMVSIEQDFPNKKYNDANQAYLSAASEVEKSQKAASLNGLYAEAKEQYYRWIIDQKKLSIVDEDAQLLRFMIANAESRYQNGLGKISAYYKAKASLGTLTKMQLELQNGILQSRIALNTLMDRDPTHPLEIDTAYTVHLYMDLVVDSEFFCEKRSDIREVNQNIQLAHLKQDMERAQMKPQFGIQYGNMFGFGGSPLQFSLMGMVRIPLQWTTRMNRANIESLHWKVLSLQDRKATMATAYSGMAYGLRENMRSQQKQVSLYEKEILPALKKNYESTQLAYEQNTEELFTLYDAWQALNQTQLDYLDQLGSLLRMQVELEKILEVK